jgi:hypothetical protein
MSATRTNGVTCLLGVDGSKRTVPTSAEVFSEFVAGNRALIGSVNAGHDDWHRAISDLGDMVGRWPDTVNNLIGLRTDVARYEDALRFGGIKATLRFE